MVILENVNSGNLELLDDLVHVLAVVGAINQIINVMKHVMILIHAKEIKFQENIDIIVITECGNNLF